MTDQNASAGENPDNTNTELTDSQVDYFFDNEGKLPDDAGGAEKEKNKDTAKTAEKVPEKKADAEATGEKADEEYKPEEYQHNKNYKQAMEAERREKAELKKQYAQIRDENEKLKQTFEKIVKASQQPQEPAPPSFDDDPLAALRYRQEQADKKLASFEEAEKQRAEQVQKNDAQQKFISTWQSQAREFEKSTPDFRDAYRHVINSRFEEYQAVGYTPEQAEQLVHEDEAAIVAQSLQQGINPAERIYRLAQMRGYARAKNESMNPVSNQQKMETLEKGMRASKSVNTGGQSSSDDMTLEGIAAMDDDEFSKVDWNKVLKLG